MSKRDTKLALVLLIIVLLIPLMIGIGVKFIDFVPYLNKIPGDNGDWIGFWGGFIGSILGIVGSLFIFQWQMKIERETTQNQIAESRKQIREEKIDNTFFNLIDLYLRNKDDIPDIAYSNTYTSDTSNKTIEELVKYNKNISKSQGNLQVNIYSQILEEIAKQVVKDTEKKHELKQQNYILKNIDEIKKMYEDIHVNDEDFIVFENQLYFLKEYSEKEYNFLIENFHNNFLGLRSYSNCYKNEQLFNYYQSRSNKLSGLYTVLMELEKEELTYEEKVSSCSKIIYYYYEILGNSFRLFHRIVKFLNENVQDENEKRNYMGILRALFSENEMLVIFYNAFYTLRGKGLREKLRNSNFFGDQIDLPLTNKNDMQHFSYKNLIFKEEDINFMRECCTTID